MAAIVFVLGLLPSTTSALAQTVAAEPVFQIDATDERHPWTKLTPLGSRDDFAFAVISDNAGGHRDGVLRRAVASLNVLRPRFVMSVGDFTNGFSFAPAELNRMWDQFMADIAPLEPPLFLTAGNHDVDSYLMRQVWTSRFGPTTFHFVYANTLFISLDTSEDGKTLVTPQQVEMVKTAVAGAPNVRWTFLFMHRPMWRDPLGLPAMEAIEKALGQSPYTVIAGHLHQYMKEVRNGRDYFTLSVTGGANELRGPVFGGIDHVLWVTMTDQGPKFANIETAHVRDENIRTPAIGSIAYAMDDCLRIPLLRSEEAVAIEMTPVIKLYNSSKLQMRVQGQFTSHPTFDIEPLAIDVNLAPGESKDWPVQLRPRRRVAIEDLRPLTFHGTATFDVANADAVTLPIDRAQPFDREFLLPHASKTLLVDADASLWPADQTWLTIDGANSVTDPDAGWTGPADASAKFSVCWDERFIRVIVDVTDDTIVTGTKSEAADGVELWLDGRSDSVRSKNNGSTREKGTLHFMVPAPAPAATDATTRDVARTEGTVTSSRRTSNGYTIEVAVPLEAVCAANGDQWDGLRMNVRVVDVDAEGGPASTIDWRPDWRSPQSYAGSGTFWRRTPGATTVK